MTGERIEERKAMSDRGGSREERAWWTRIALPAAGVTVAGLVAVVAWLLLRPEGDPLEPIRTVNEAGDTIVYSGRVRDAVARARIVEALNSVAARPEDTAADGSVGDSARLAAAARDARQAAVDELARLYEDPADPEDVVAALNLAIIDFAAGAAELPRDAAGFIQGAAEGIQRLPDETVIVVAGYMVEAEGSALDDEETDLAIAEADLAGRRARAVVDALVDAGADAERLRAEAREGAPPGSTDESDGADGAANGSAGRRVFFELAEVPEEVPAEVPEDGDPDERQSDSLPEPAPESSLEDSLDASSGAAPPDSSD
jgi:outer membrane protein OmpA-like peptidoglycan-associated protein